LTAVKTPTFVALGNFDGVHRGHQRVIEPILTAARAGSVSPDQPEEISVKADSAYATVVTFHPHPQEFFTGQRRTLLTPLAEKVSQLQAMGVDQLVLLPFNQALAELTPAQFIETVLVQQLQARRISVGQDFCFGKNRSGTTTELRSIASQYGIPVEVAPLYTCQEERISSSAIRQALAQGDLDHASRLLGRSYTLIGEVVRGQQLGRTIGFPTANLQLPEEKFVPRQGVYSVRVSCAGLTAANQPLPGVMNIGYRPTVEGKQQTIEVHLLDWSGDLYGQTLTVSLENFLRPEQKFASLDELKAQIQADSATARAMLATSQST
jgi:riboflavin kinase/FMN adenylyltransferase